MLHHSSISISSCPVVILPGVIQHPFLLVPQHLIGLSDGLGDRDSTASAAADEGGGEGEHQHQHPDQQQIVTSYQGGSWLRRVLQLRTL